MWRDFRDVAAAALLAVGAGDPAAASATFTWASWLGVGIPV